jgi:pilus assembly protein CpaD
MKIVSAVKRQLLKTGGVLMLAGLTGFMGGCRHGFNEKIRPDLYTGSLYERADTLHPIHVTKGHLAMGVKVRRNATKLLPYERNEVRTFLSYYRNQATGRLKVRLPSNSPYQAAVNKMLYGIQRELVDMGLEPEMVQVKRFSGRGDRYPVIHLSFKRYEAHGPECKLENENLARSENNANGRYWGCANQNNLAAMIQNPRDLKGPRGWSPRDARRRDMVWDKYIKGEPSGATRSQDERVDTRTNKK